MTPRHGLVPPVLAALLTLGALLPAGACAAPKALIVGVGDYQDPRISDLSNSGVPEDVEMYRDIATRFGIPAGNIRVLKDSDATAANIVRALRGWLREGVRSDDLVMFAFSGHGTRVRDSDGDEPDGLDEALVPHDSTMRDRTSYNLVIDDQLHALLAANPSRRLISFIDSCHSRSVATRAVLEPNELGVTEVQARFHAWDTVPEANVLEGVELDATRSVDTTQQGYLALSAAQDEQFSYGSAKGGIFTLSVYRQIQDMTDAGVARTPIELIATAANDIARWARDTPDKRFEPNAAGPGERLRAPLPLAITPAGDGPTWKRLLALVEQRSAELDLRINRSSFRVGEKLQISAMLPQAGYLNIVSVDARDRATVLFPNRSNPDNRVGPGAISLPTQEMPFDLVAGEPLGQTLVVALLSSEDVNLFKSGFDGREGALPFRALSMQGVRAFQVTGRERLLAGKVIATVRR